MGLEGWDDQLPAGDSEVEGVVLLVVHNVPRTNV